MAKTKADYYEWLMKKHDNVTQQLKRIPKISLEEQAKKAQLVEYNASNQRKVNFYRKVLEQINEEARRITRQ